jgi:hypothetical protein
MKLGRKSRDEVFDNQCRASHANIARSIHEC